MLQLSEQEDLIVWMRTAALPTFRKLYGKLEVDLEPNEEIMVTIQNNYNTYSFGGKKKLVLSTTSWIGGKNDFLGMAYLTFGGVSILVAVAFILIHLIRPRFVLSISAHLAAVPLPSWATWILLFSSTWKETLQIAPSHRPAGFLFKLLHLAIRAEEPEESGERRRALTHRPVWFGKNRVLTIIKWCFLGC